MPARGCPAMKAWRAVLQMLAGLGTLVGYGCLLSFLYLVGMQTYRWFREGEWMHIGMGDGIRFGLVHCCVKDGGSGRLAGFLPRGGAPGAPFGVAQGIVKHPGR